MCRVRPATAFHVETLPVVAVTDLVIADVQPILQRVHLLDDMANALPVALNSGGDTQSRKDKVAAHGFAAEGCQLQTARLRIEVGRLTVLEEITQRFTLISLAINYSYSPGSRSNSAGRPLSECVSL